MTSFSRAPSRNFTTHAAPRPPSPPPPFSPAPSSSLSSLSSHLFRRGERGRGIEGGTTRSGSSRQGLLPHTITTTLSLSSSFLGTFGRVFECWDRKVRGYVAVKVVRNVQKYRDAAMIELAVLATLAANDSAAHFHCVHLRDWFDYRGHVCMVFERLGPSLYDFLRKNHYRPFPARLVRAFGRQLLEATAYLHALRLVHTDLKPENVLLVAGDYDRVEPVGGVGGVLPAAAAAATAAADAAPAPNAPATALAAAAARGGGTAARVPRSSAVRVIDFGSATFEDAHHSAVVSTRHYRAPEVILGLGWSYPADLWSLGCILLELATGDALFQTHENLEHLAMMEAALGVALPSSLASRASPAATRLFRDGPPVHGAPGASAPPRVLDWPEAASSRRSVRAVQKVEPIRAQLEARADPSLRVGGGADALADLVARLLQYEPSARLSASDALAHPFFALGGGDEGEGVAWPPPGTAGAAAWPALPVGAAPAPAPEGGEGAVAAVAAVAAAPAVVVAAPAEGGGGGGGGGARSEGGSNGG